MRIVPYLNNDDLYDIESMSVIIKAIPFEDSFVPAFLINVNSENYEVTLDELSSLMDGLEIAMKHVDGLISWAIQPQKPSEASSVPDDVMEELLSDEDDEGDCEE